MNALSTPTALSLLIGTDEFLGFQMIALSAFILLMSFNDEPAKRVCALSGPSVSDTKDFSDFLFSAKPDLSG